MARYYRSWLQHGWCWLRGWAALRRQAPSLRSTRCGAAPRVDRDRYAGNLYVSIGSTIVKVDAAGTPSIVGKLADAGGHLCHGCEVRA